MPGVTVTMQGSATGFTMTAQGSGGARIIAYVQPETGQQLGVGTFDTAYLADATHVGLNIDSSGAGCNPPGSMTISELTWDADGITPATLTASFVVHCLTRPSFGGELRYRSVTPYTAMSLTGPADFGSVPQGNTFSDDFTLTNTGTGPLTLGTATITGSSAASFAVTGTTCSSTLAVGSTCRVSVHPGPLDYGPVSAGLTVQDGTVIGVRSLTVSADGFDIGVGSYYPLASRRILDTRTKNTPLGPNATMTLQVAGAGKSIEPGQASTIVVNVTVVGTTAASDYLTLFPYGKPRPTVSSINVPRGVIRANLVTVPISADGKVSIYNAFGSAHVVLDLVGFYVAIPEIVGRHTTPAYRSGCSTAAIPARAGSWDPVMRSASASLIRPFARWPSTSRASTPLAWAT